MGNKYRQIPAVERQFLAGSAPAPRHGPNSTRPTRVIASPATRSHLFTAGRNGAAETAKLEVLTKIGLFLFLF
jgi:hypothetical protein